MPSIKETYAFLLDENVCHLADAFPKSRCKTVDDYDARGADDARIVKLAGDKKLIIVTNNTRDFTRAIRRMTQTGDPSRCVNGLLTLGADTKTRQRDFFPLEKIEQKMSLNGTPVTWRLVGFGNLWVHVRHSRVVEVSRLTPCPCLDRSDRDRLDEAFGPVLETRSTAATKERLDISTISSRNG